MKCFTKAIGRIKGFRRQTGGTVAVEFAFLFPIAAIFTFSLIEFSLIIFDYHQLGESTRSGSRTAILQSPVGDLENLASADVTCTGSGGTPNNYNVSCTNGATNSQPAFQAIVQAMQAIKPDIVGNNVIVTYRDTGVTGGAESPDLITPTITVELTGYQYTYFIMGQVDSLFGVQNGTATNIADGGGFTFPNFATSRVGATQNVAS